MHVSVVEEEKGMLKVEVKGESATLTQLIAKQAWEERGEAAAVREHPFMVEPKILVMGTNPRRILERAAAAVGEQCDEFKEQFRRAMRE